MNLTGVNEEELAGAVRRGLKDHWQVFVVQGLLSRFRGLGDCGACHCLGGNCRLRRLAASFFRCFQGGYARPRAARAGRLALAFARHPGRERRHYHRTVSAARRGHPHHAA